MILSISGCCSPSSPEQKGERRTLIQTRKARSCRCLCAASQNTSQRYYFWYKFPLRWCFIVEGVSFHAPFVEVVLREDNLVSVYAPALSTSEQNPMGSLMLAMSGFFTALRDSAQAAGSNSQELEALNIPTAEGVLTVSTTKDMTIQTNNSAEGPSTTQSGQRLVWQINGETTTPPSALIQIAP